MIKRRLIKCLCISSRHNLFTWNPCRSIIIKISDRLLRILLSFFNFKWCHISLKRFRIILNLIKLTCLCWIYFLIFNLRFKTKISLIFCFRVIFRFLSIWIFYISFVFLKLLLKKWRLIIFFHFFFIIWVVSKLTKYTHYC